MIFDDVNRSGESPRSGRQRRRSGDGTTSRRRRSRFETASRIASDDRHRGDRSTAAWLGVLGLLVVAAFGFGLFLQQQKSGGSTLWGEAPGKRLVVFVDPILAPLETGTSGYDPAELEKVIEALQGERNTVGLDDKEIYSTAITLADILREAADDRTRHLQRLVELGSPVIGMSGGEAPARTDLSEVARRHHELAVDVSWQRNSGTYRNRAEELLARLTRLEKGRFRSPASASAASPDNHAPQIP